MYEIKIEGLSKLEEKLREIGTKEAINILTKAGKEALLPVLNDMKKMQVLMKIIKMNI